MKKIMALVLAAAAALSLFGCVKKDEGPAAGTPVSDFYQAVIDAQPEQADELVFFQESDPNLIESFYPGILDIELGQQAFYMPPIATHPCEIVLAEAKNAEDADKVEAIFKARIDLGADNTTYPDSAEGWARNARVQRSGNFVCMIVLPEGYTIPENIFALA